MKFEYELKQAVGILSQHNRTTKEVNLIAYSGGKAKLDIRTWDTKADGSKTMYKGITLDKEEAMNLKKVLEEFDFSTME